MRRWQSNGIFRAAAWTAALVMGLALMAACGKKGPPRLPDVEAPAGVRDLAAAREDTFIVLKWTAAVEKDAAAPQGYYVYRSAEPAGEDACAGCPVLFRRAAQVALGGDPTLEYREPIVPGTRYRFKVVPYDAAGQLGPDSNIVRIVTD